MPGSASRAAWLRAFALAALPWRASDAAVWLTAREAFGIAAVNIIFAAALSTSISNWVYLAAKGYLLGSREMDLGQDDLPPDTLGQVGVGLAATMVIWCVLLALVVVVALFVADAIFARDRRGYGEATRLAAAATPWLLVSAVASVAVQIVQGVELTLPRRWPEGTSFEVRQRLLPLLAWYPLAWSVGLAARGSWRASAAAVLLYWLVWALLWRILPWTALEAYTG